MKPEAVQESYAGKGWILHGLIWGAIMFLIMGMVIPLVQKEVLTAGSLARASGLWSVAGLAYGRAMKAYMAWAENRKRR